MGSFGFSQLHGVKGRSAMHGLQTIDTPIFPILLIE